MKLSLLIATAALAYTALLSTSGASTFTGQQPADAAAGELAARAVTFWHQHGLAACPDGLTIWEAPKLPYGDGQEAWGMGDGATCEIWLSRALANQIDAPLWLGDGIAACTAMTHEVGHAFGLGHTAKGVMAGSGAPKRMYGWSPRFCWRWARFQDAAELRDEGQSERRIRRVIRSEELLIRS